MPNVEVKCSISNCSFYGEGNICQADKIMVDLDAHSSFATEFASELGYTDHIDKARHSSMTCCRTFKPKKKQD